MDVQVCINNIDASFDKQYGYQIELRKKLEVGYYVQIKFSTNPPVEFGNYFLPMSVHEKAARAAGMQGKFGWDKIMLPADHEEVNSYMVEPVPKGYFDDFLRYPDFGVLVVEKS